MPGPLPGIHVFQRFMQDVDGTRNSACSNCVNLLVETANRVNPICGDKPGHDENLNCGDFQHQIGQPLGGINRSRGSGGLRHAGKPRSIAG